MAVALQNHHKISPTAKLVAYWRQFADIPFSKDIAQNFEVEKTMVDVFGREMIDISQKDVFISLVEVRYKCIQNLILKRKMKQVLEFASGISLRGLAMTQDPTLTYVETDLPDLTNEKKSLIQNIMDKNHIKPRPNLFFHSVNILQYSEIEPLLEHFDPKQPLFIVHEGLFQYLTKEEKKIASKNIHKVLSRFGGVWVTPDLDTKSKAEDFYLKNNEFKKMMETINSTTERNFDHNAFENDAEIFTFFQNLGFKVSCNAQYDQDMQLTCLDPYNSTKEALDALKKLRLWTLEIK